MNTFVWKPVTLTLTLIGRRPLLSQYQPYAPASGAVKLPAS
jgi:hypothetical protein